MVPGANHAEAAIGDERFEGTDVGTAGDDSGIDEQDGSRVGGKIRFEMRELKFQDPPQMTADGCGHGGLKSFEPIDQAIPGTGDCKGGAPGGDRIELIDVRVFEDQNSH